MRISTAVLVLIACFSLISCEKGCQNNDTKGVVAPSERVKKDKPESVIRLSDEELEAVTEHLDEYFTTMSELKFDEYLDRVYPRAITSEEMRQSAIDMMQDYADRGYINVTNDFSIKHASPLVKDTLDLVTLLIVEIDHDVYVGEQFEDNPEGLEPIIRSQYGKDQFRYIPEEKKYKVEGFTKLYALTPIDTLDFTFLNEQYIQSPQLANLLKYTTVKELKKFEQEVR